MFFGINAPHEGPRTLDGVARAGDDGPRVSADVAGVFKELLRVDLFAVVHRAPHGDALVRARTHSRRKGPLRKVRSV